MYPRLPFRNGQFGQRIDFLIIFCQHLSTLSPFRHSLLSFCPHSALPQFPIHHSRLADYRSTPPERFSACGIWRLHSESLMLLAASFPLFLCTVERKNCRTTILPSANRITKAGLRRYMSCRSRAHNVKSPVGPGLDVTTQTRRLRSLEAES